MNAKHVGFLWAVLWWLLATAVSGADELEVEAALREWGVDPLDLRVAAADEIALLPWISASEAEAVAGLASRGELRRLEDLLVIPGLTRVQVEAIAPFVEPAWNPVSRSAGLRATILEDRRLDAGEPPSTQRRVRLEASGGELAWRDVHGRRLVHATARTGRWSLGYGQLLPRSASPLLLADPIGRSRSGLMPWTTRSRPGARRTLAQLPSQRAMAVEGVWDRLRGVAFVADVGETRAWVEAGSSSANGGWSLALAQHDDGSREAMLQLRRTSGSLGTRFDLAGAPGRWRSFLQLRWTEHRWRVALNSTRSAVGSLRGRDPISHATLKYPLRAWQLGLRQVTDGVRWSLFARRVERVREAEVEARHRVRFEVDPRASSANEGRWHLRLGLDEAGLAIEPGAVTRSSVDFDLHAAWQEGRGNSRRRVRVWFRGQRGSSSRAVAFDLRRSGTWDLSAAVAASAGSRSHPWAVGLPAAGVQVQWLHPHEPRLHLAALRRWHGSRGDLEMGAWFSGSVGSQQRPGFGGGWVVAVRRAGAKVAQ